jgi:hypothetical protein
MERIIFLLGGYDLEMLEIKKILEERDGLLFFDKHLTWENAKLSMYDDILHEYGNQDNTEIYGIELREDGCPFIPANYKAIDHHNNLNDRVSSLEQLAEILQLKLSREQQLIAANDKGYIPEMKKMGATQEEIEQIRLKDRQMQGVSESDEQQAEEAINNKTEEKGIIVVKSVTNRFSPVCDRLFPYDRLFIYTDDEWMYYGKGKNKLVDFFKEEIGDGKIYHGGGDEGYIGMAKNTYSQKEILKTKEIIIQILGITYSYHIFYFPFKWELKDKKDKLFSERTNIENIKPDTFSNWLYNPAPVDDREAGELYNEKNYYYKFVHPVLYDTGKRDSILKHYERKETQTGDVYYKIARKDKTYTLHVDAMNLNLYATGVGMLTFFLRNEQENQKSPEDILTINQYGRRIFPLFIGDIAKRGQIAESLSIEGLYGNPDRYKEDFSGYTCENSWKPACFIENLIKDLSESIQIEPVIDDRMFVNCWYGNNELSKKIKNGELNIDKSEPGKKEIFNDQDDFWYKYIFVDTDTVCCQNSELRKELTCRHTYKRWQEGGTLYGISRYSLVLLTDEEEFAKDVLLVHTRTLHSRMVELLLIQRASILKFSNETTNVSKIFEDGKGYESMISEISSLYRAYIRFVNQIYFREIVAQDQGIELYQLMTDILDIENQIKDLDDEIEELHQYVSLKNSERLNIIAVILLPATLVASLFGMNNTNGLVSFWWQLLIAIGSSLIACIFFLKFKK